MAILLLLVERLTLSLKQIASVADIHGLAFHSVWASCDGTFAQFSSSGSNGIHEDRSCDKKL